MALDQPDKLDEADLIVPSVEVNEIVLRKLCCKCKDLETSKKIQELVKGPKLEDKKQEKSFLYLIVVSFTIIKYLRMTFKVILALNISPFFFSAVLLYT